MQYESFVKETRDRTGLNSSWAAIDAARSVLDTLLECLPGALAAEVAARLPHALLSHSSTQPWTSGERLSVGEFLMRVATREDVDEASAFCHAQAVLQMLAASLGFDLVERVRAELSTEFDELWGADPRCVHMHQPIVA